MSHELLARLCAVSQCNRGQEPDTPGIADTWGEAQQLWRTLETWIVTGNESYFPRTEWPAMLACTHAVLSCPRDWRWPPREAACARNSMHEDKHSVFVCVLRVLVKFACRGEDERCAVMNTAIVELLVAMLNLGEDARGGDPGHGNTGDGGVSVSEAASMMQLLHTLASDPMHRPALVLLGVVAPVLILMTQLAQDMKVQLCGCKFLQCMAYDDTGKASILEHHGLRVLLGAMYHFGNDLHLVSAVLDALYFICQDIEHSPTAQVEATLTATVEDVVACVLHVLHEYPRNAQVQVPGVSILTLLATTVACARRLLSEHAGKELWRIADRAFEVSDEASADAVELLGAVLSDSSSYASMECLLKVASTPQETCEQLRLLSSISAIKSRLEIQSNLQSLVNTRGIVTVTTRLQELMDSTNLPSPLEASHCDDTDNSMHVAQPDRCHPVKPTSVTRSFTEKYSSTMDDTPLDINFDDDDSWRLLDENSPFKEDLHVGNTTEDPHDYSRDLDIDDELEVPIDEEEKEDASPVRFGDANAVSDASSISSEGESQVDTHKETLDTEITSVLEQVSAIQLQCGREGDGVHLARNGPDHATPSATASPPLSHNNSTNLLSEPSTRLSASTEPTADSSRRADSETTVILEETEKEGEAQNWRWQCETVSRQLCDHQARYRILEENYRVVHRRAQEQAKLLSLQNTRVRHHGDVHHQIMERVSALEAALQDAVRRHNVERELRLAEAAQAERIAYELHEAMKEIKALNAQNSTTARELMEREKVRADYQQRASEVKARTTQLEEQRDDAVLQSRMLQLERAEMRLCLEACRREGMEALLMREEDVDARKPNLFHEVLWLSPTRKRPKDWPQQTQQPLPLPPQQKQLQCVQGHGGPTQRRSTFVGAPSQSSMIRSMEVAAASRQISLGRGGSSNVGHVVAHSSVPPRSVVLDDDGMVPPMDEAPFETRDEGMDPEQIELQLNAFYDTMDGATEGNGVHLATVRRFIVECGVVQPPLVLADVDNILAKVVAQAQENRRRVVVRKDFSHGGMSRKSVAMPVEAKRLRFFDVETFYEAMTLLCARRFPRLDVKRALELFVMQYVQPMQRTRSRRYSTGALQYPRNGHAGGTTGAATSPTAVGVIVLKAILNALALHVGHSSDQHECDPHFPGEFNTAGDRSHSLLPSSAAVDARRHKTEDVIYSMLEMHTVLAREYKPLATICEFYSSLHYTPRELIMRDDKCVPLSFDLVLNFAMDFEIIPSFMDRMSLKHLYSEVGGHIKTYFSAHKKVPHATDPETLKKVAFSMMLARLAIELFSAKRDYETPERQITALLQWIDNSVGRQKVMKKAMVPIVIKFSRKLYILKT